MPSRQRGRLSASKRLRLSWPTGPSTSTTKTFEFCPVLRPMLACLHLLHQLLMVSSSVVASFTPFGVLGCLPGRLHVGSPHAHPPSFGSKRGRTGMPVAAYRNA